MVMRLQDHFHPATQPLGLCGRCCQEYAAGQRPAHKPPNAAVAVLATTIQAGPAMAVVPLPTCGDHIEGDAKQAGNGKSQLLVAQQNLPPGLRG